MISVVRFYDGLYLIGKYENHSLVDPYQIIMGAEGIQLVPFDEWILGRKINPIDLDHSHILYIQEPDRKLKDVYLEALTGIETKKSDIIV